MSDQRLAAHLNLFAVLQNLEDLPALDGDAGRPADGCREAVQFSVVGGPSAWVAFDGGACRHGRGRHERPTISLLFVSPGHLNAMFAGRAVPPVPVRGVTRLGFLKGDFTRLTKRLEYHLRATGPDLEAPERLRATTAMTLNTAVHAARELAALEPESQRIASRIAPGVLEIGVPPDGPFAWLEFGPDGPRAGKGRAERPAALMHFRDVRAAYDLLSGRVDGFRAVADGSLALWGRIPLIDDVGLILDRVSRHLA